MQADSETYGNPSIREPEPVFPFAGDIGRWGVGEIGKRVRQVKDPLCTFEAA